MLSSLSPGTYSCKTPPLTYNLMWNPIIFYLLINWTYRNLPFYHMASWLPQEISVQDFVKWFCKLASVQFLLSKNLYLCFFAGPCLWPISLAACQFTPCSVAVLARCTSGTKPACGAGGIWFKLALPKGAGDETDEFSCLLPAWSTSTILAGPVASNTFACPCAELMQCTSLGTGLEEGYPNGSDTSCSALVILGGHDSFLRGLAAPP